MASTVSERVEALREAIALGAQRVTYDGKTVEYRSLKEMRDVLADLEAQAAGRPRRRRRYAVYSSGT
ncbi:phage head-tail joining protein [Ancylobacter oerskovii]|uniref:Phage head-tail joining protein n=1 Tax=Ancylobacter oerskovii TaxID=459519 RepID=A0ABW4Z2S8_9HYPH|nr:hypothetical protein [Ancylobacter oerskovii]MBS7546238.1 hypothetical protein [Ancylobacter oerskovii]